jgi:hypothetical protein
MNKHVYINILQEYLIAIAEELGIQENFLFCHDSDPKHSSHLVRRRCLYNWPIVIKTPPQLPDLSVIENLWAELGKNKNILNFQQRRSEEGFESGIGKNS